MKIKLENGRFFLEPYTNEVESELRALSSKGCCVRVIEEAADSANRPHPSGRTHPTASSG